MSAPKFDVYAHVTQAIIAELEKGTPPWRKPWSGSAPSLPLRVTGEPYRGVNVLVLWRAAQARGYACPTWMTYRQAKALGGQVRRGERGATVIKVGTVERESKVPGEDPERISFARAYRVFNLAQIDGLDDRFPAPAPPRDFGTQADPGLMAWFARTGLRLQTTPEPRAYYCRARDMIHMPPAETFEDARSYAGTLLHEAVHATGHKTRLDRDMSGGPDSRAYAMEELVGEIGSAMAGARLGIAPQFEQNAAYVQSWIEALWSDSRAIVRAASAAQAASDWLMAAGGELAPTE